MKYTRKVVAIIGFTLLVSLVSVIVIFVVLFRKDLIRLEHKEDQAFKKEQPVPPVKKDSVVAIAENFKPVFHVRVEYATDWGDECKYFVKYTNDDWTTSQALQHAFDISSPIMGNDVVKQEMFLGLDNAIRIARQYNTYQKCIRHDSLVQVEYERLTRFREKHPILKQEEKKRDECVKQIDIY